MYYKKIAGAIFFFLILLVQASHANKAELTVSYHSKNNIRICNKSLQNCTIQISQNGCLPSNGSVTITNNSSIPALNIVASSNDPNFKTYIVQNNNCPTSLLPGASCTISFYTNSFVAFVSSGVSVRGSNTTSTAFDINAVYCGLIFNVTSNGDTHVSVTPQSQDVTYGSTATFTATPDPGYSVSINSTCPTNFVGGTYAILEYTTGPITAPCSVNFTSTLKSFTVNSNGDTHVAVTPASQNVNYGSTTTFTVTPDSGYSVSIGGTCPIGSLVGTTYTTGTITSDCSVNFTSTLQNFAVNSNGDTHVAVTPASQNVNYGSTTTFTVTPDSGYSVSIGGTCPAGSLVGTTYTTGTITSDCSVDFTSVAAFFPAAAGPSNVIVVPGNSKATINWTAPTNIGEGTISGYTVTYGPSSGTTFTTEGCTTTGALSCEINELNNGTSYIFTVATMTTLNGVNETGPVTFSSPVTPGAGVTVSPSTLALSGLGGGVVRTMTLTNNSVSSINITSVAPPSPALPGSAVVNTAPATDCTKVGTLAAGGSCTITIDPGASGTSTSTCTTGIAPTPSTIAVNTSSGTINTNVVILGYGCQYQGGYLFSIDDTTPATGSMGGTVVASSAMNNGAWSSNDDNIWGTAYSSTTTNPSPNSSSSPPATLKLGQLNCDAVNDGACSSTNIIVYYGPGSYAAGICNQSWNNTSASCSGGSNCYSDWYLPSLCEMGPFGSTGIIVGDYPRFNDSQTCTVGSTNIQEQLVTTNIMTGGGFTWSSNTGLTPSVGAQYFASTGDNQSLSTARNNNFNAQCVRKLTLS